MPRGHQTASAIFIFFLLRLPCSAQQRMGCLRMKNGKFYAFLPSDERVNSCKMRNWHRAIGFGCSARVEAATEHQRQAITRAQSPRNWGSESVYKLVSLLRKLANITWSHKFNSIPKGWIVLYQALQSETWEVREQRKRARNLSWGFFLRIHHKTNLCNFALSAARRWSRKLFKC